MTLRTATVGALLIAILLAASVPAAAHERTLSVEVKEDAEVEIRSETALSEGEVDFKFKASHSSWPRLVVAVERELENESASTEIEVEMHAVFREVFEFEDVNGNSMKDAGEARLSTVRLDSLTYEPVAVESYTADGLDGFKVTVRGSMNGFSFGLVSYIFPSNAQVNGTPVPEQAVKVDILLEGYNYVSETSSLGLVVKMESTVEREVHFEDESKEVQVASERGTAFFEWVPEAVVDGQTATVQAEWSAGNETLILYYPHGETIIHDPLIGFEISPGSPFLNAVALALMGGFGLLTAAAIFMAIRRRA